MNNFYRNYPYQNTSSQNNWSSIKSDSKPISTPKTPPISPPHIYNHKSQNQSSFSINNETKSQKDNTAPCSISKQKSTAIMPNKRKKLPPKKERKKFDFKCFKKDACSSLNDVECFLNNFSNFIKYVKLINLLK